MDDIEAVEVREGIGELRKDDLCSSLVIKQSLVDHYTSSITVLVSLTQVDQGE